MKALILLISLVLPFVLEAQNLVDSHGWTTGSGSIEGFNQNGTDSQNIREYGIDPYGGQSILWKAVSDAANSSDGGWDTSPFAITHSKMYRFAVWIKKTNSHDGHTYLGPSYNNDILNLDGSYNSNPYFFVGDLPSLNKWYLVVGYVHGSGDPSTVSYGGIYDSETGAKVVALTDFKFSVSATTANQRAYLYYDVNTSDRQYFYGPEVYELPGPAPLVETIGSSYVSGNALFGKKVGIGTNNPSGDLHIHSSNAEVYMVSDDDWAAMRGKGGTWLFGYNGNAGSEDISIGTQDQAGSRTLTFAAGGTARMKILSDGNVGIGTTSPNEKLTVNGTIYGKEVKVDLSVPGPDYVFEKDYNLPTLDEIKSYIDQHKHLPEVPSAKEMEENGINVGEMNMILLKKVEELTLHIIKQNKRIEALEAIVTEKN